MIWSAIYFDLKEQTDYNIAIKERDYWAETYYETENIDDLSIVLALNEAIDKLNQLDSVRIAYPESYKLLYH